jgi:anti-anti-sigma factor
VEKLVGSEQGPVREFAARAGLLLLAPIYVHDELIGILGLGARQDGVPRAKIDLKLLESCLAIASIALENGRFYGQLLEKGRELRLANERLGELDRLKFEFLGNINHELRTPLAVIIASLDCLGRVEKDGSPAQEFLTYATTQAQKLLGMVEGLLHLTAAGQDTHRPIASIGNIVDSVTSYHRDRLPGLASGLHEFTLTIEAQALQTCFDERHVRTILDALLDNAVKFTPAGTRIQLRVCEASEHGERWARIDVEDNGPGIPPERLPKLFEPFQQLDGSMTRAAGGLGIGLALARRLAHEMGGRLAAVSEVGAGSTFSLFLPAAVQFAPKPADEGDKGRVVPMSQDLEMSNLENHGRTAVLRLKGRLDVKTSPLLLQKVSEIQANGQNLVLNLAGVTFMGSSGIGALLVIVEQFQEQAGAVRLASPSPAVASVIKLLNLDRFLAVDASEEKSLSEIGA